MNSLPSTAHVDERQICIVLPADLPVPKFSFNQRVRVRSGCNQGIAGAIWGLEYINLKAARDMGFEYEGWCYYLHTDPSAPRYALLPHACCEEQDLAAEAT